MRKAIKIIAIIIGLILVGLIGRCFYMIACISCTYPPIKEWAYHGSVDQLGSSIQKFIVSNPAVSVKISRRDSSSLEDNGDRDMEIKIKKDTSNLTYGLVCDQGTNNTEIKLVSAFRNNKYGGYTGDAPGVKELLNDFENDFLVKLMKEQHIVFKSE